MRFIRKAEEPESFRRWKAGDSADWRPSYASLRDSPEVKRQLLAALAIEQGYLCCYCGCRIPPHHIEHFRPQHGPHGEPALDLDHGNLLASCEQERNPPAPRRCGHRKGDWWHERLLVSPLDPRCATYFLYGSDGSIRPASGAPDRAASEETIRRLGLDTLTVRRKKAIEALLLEDELPREDLLRLRALCEEPDGEGQLVEFAATLTSVLDLYLG